MKGFPYDQLTNKQQRPRQPLDHPAQNSRRQFQELLTCFICYSHLNNPMMCPYCSKLYCQGCIKRCLLQKQQCPHCRKPIRGITNMASCNRFVNQLITIVNQLIDQKVQQQMCKQHQVQINYFCQDCALPICCQCQIFGLHQGHHLKRLAIIYQARYDALREMLTEFKSKLREKQITLKDVENQLNQLKKLKERNLKQLEQFTEHYKAKIIQQTSKQTSEIQQSVNKYNDIITSLNKLQQQLTIKSQQAQKSGTYIIDEDFIKKIQTQLKVQLPKIDEKQKSILQQVIPPFFETVFIIPNFYQKKKQKSCIYSPIQKYQGSQWRLKVYLNGIQNFENYMSIFLQMVSTIHESTVYQYQIQLVNKKNLQQNMVRQSHAKFSVGQIKGYNKYITLDNLMRQGFIDSVSNQIEIHYFVRNPFYYNIYKQKQTYIQHLDNQIIQQEMEIKELESLLQKNSEI